MALYRLFVSLVLLVGLAVLVGGCGEDSGSLTCGSGTHEENGECVADGDDDDQQTDGGAQGDTEVASDNDAGSAEDAGTAEDATATSDTANDTTIDATTMGTCTEHEINSNACHPSSWFLDLAETECGASHHVVDFSAGLGHPQSPCANLGNDHAEFKCCLKG